MKSRATFCMISFAFVGKFRWFFFLFIFSMHFSHVFFVFFNSKSFFGIVNVTWDIHICLIFDIWSLEKATFLIISFIYQPVIKKKEKFFKLSLGEIGFSIGNFPKFHCG